MPGVAAGALEREPWGEEEPRRTRVTVKPFAGGHKGENYVGTFFFPNVSRPWRVRGAIRRRRIVSQY